MSKFLYHEPCEVCGSRDNKAVFDDGHTFCFGCRHTTGNKTNLKTIHEEALAVVKTELTKLFPSDATEDIPNEPLLWLLKNRITYKEIKEFSIKWSPFRELLCWQIKGSKGSSQDGNGTIIGWQGRCFANSPKTKYISHGKIHEDICILGIQKPVSFCDGGDAKVVLVEDYISAIRVSEHLPCIPLFGCTCGLEALQAIKKRFSSVLVWLDADKLDNARKIGLNANLMGLGSQVLYTTKDPKEYTSNEIKEYLKCLK